MNDRWESPSIPNPEYIVQNYHGDVFVNLHYTNPNTPASDVFDEICRIAHEANRIVQRINGEEVDGPWEQISKAKQTSTIAGVTKVMEGETPEELHESWVYHKLKLGWTYGPEKSEDKKTHPCMVPYNQLSRNDRVKDHMFQNVVNAIFDALSYEG